MFGASAVGAQAKKVTPVPRAKAVELYTGNCQLCHGADGKGTPLIQGSAFVNRAWKHGSTLAAVEKTITEGVPKTAMMPFEEKFSPEEIAGLAELVRSYDPALKTAPVKKQ